MEPLVRIDAADAADLQMENELLRYETIHLRARLAEAEQRAASGPPAAAPPADDEARADLIWLLNRLDKTPAGPLLRRFAGFRTLQHKYGVGTDA